jgi:hypothetical protein
VTKPAWVNIAPISNSIKVRTERIGSALARNVILSNRVLGIVADPLFPIAAVRRLKALFLLTPTAVISFTPFGLKKHSWR